MRSDVECVACEGGPMIASRKTLDSGTDAAVTASWIRADLGPSQ